jgi:hypothetical protein
MSSAPSNSRNGVLSDQLLGYAMVLTIELCFLRSVPRLCNEISIITGGSDTCGGGVEYVHRDPASRRRRRQGKSQN